MSAATPIDRPNNREVENENMKPARDGQPPRPATEPKGAQGSSKNPETLTDPATGEPTRSTVDTGAAAEPAAPTAGKRSAGGTYAPADVSPAARRSKARTTKAEPAEPAPKPPM
jgi:hypothetical protein